MSKRDFYQGMLDALHIKKADLRENYERQIQKLEQQEKTVLEWQKAEGGPPEYAQVIPPRKPKLSEFLRQIVKDGNPRTNAELAELAKAKGILNGKVDLRVINSIMLGFMKAKLVERKNERW